MAPQKPQKPVRAISPYSVDAAVGPAVMARAQGVIVLAAGLLGYTGVLLPHDAAYNELGLIAIQATAVVGGAMLIALGGRTPEWVLRVNPPLCTVLTTLAVYFSGDVTSAYALFYFWTCIYAFYFFSRWEAFLNLGFACVNYAAAVLIMGAPQSAFPESGVAHHLVMTLGTLAVTGAYVVALRGRVNRLFVHLSEAGKKDALTGLLNRLGFRDAVETELERIHRSTERPLSLLVADLDRFKQINDRHGDDVGDRVIAEVGRLLDESAGLIDAVARVGGEDFAIMLPETPKHSAYLLAEKLMADVRIRFAREQFSLTTSFGIATFPEDSDSFDGLMSAADQALSAAKALGRDRAVVYSPEVTGTLGIAAGRRNVEGQAQLATVLSLAEALDQRDSSTAKHSQTVGRLCELMAIELGFEEEKVQRIRLAGVLHDIGKIGVPDSILQKPGPLTDEERLHMQRHPELGARILSSREMDDIRGWISAHHERPDGKGYPKGISGEEIPVEASILAVADAYEAMTSDRVYRPALGEEAARRELLSCAGTQFDRRVVQALLLALDTEGVTALEV